MNTLTTSKFQFSGQTSYYKGKVREVFGINDDVLVMVASDRLSAFDVVLPKGIPFKGQVLNQMASFWFNKIKNIVPNHLTYEAKPYMFI